METVGIHVHFYRFPRAAAARRQDLADTPVKAILLHTTLSICHNMPLSYRFQRGLRWARYPGTAPPVPAGTDGRTSGSPLPPRHHRVFCFISLTWVMWGDAAALALISSLGYRYATLPTSRRRGPVSTGMGSCDVRESNVARVTGGFSRGSAFLLG